MQPRNFIILAAVAGISLGLATAALIAQDRPLTTSSLDQPLTPGLAGKVNDVVRIEASGPDGSATLERHVGEGWTVAEKGGFPADDAAVVGLLRKLSELRIVEAKTALPERLARLQLEDPTKPGAQSGRIVLKDAAGRTIEDLVIGKRAADATGSGQSGTYVRLNGQSQAWLTDADLAHSTAAADWIATDVIDIARNRVKLVSLEPDNGVLVTTSRASPDAASFDLAGVPAGESADQAKLDELAAVFSPLTLIDIKPVAEVAFHQAPQKARVETFDGLSVQFTWISLPDASWLKVDTAAAAPGASKEVQDEASRIAKRTSGWAYHVGGYVTEELGKKLADFLVKPDAS